MCIPFWLWDGILSFIHVTLHSEYLISLPENKPFRRGGPIFETNESKDYLYPPEPSVASNILSDSPLADLLGRPPLSLNRPTATCLARPASPRMPVALLYFQLGTCTDDYQPSLTDILRPAYLDSNEQLYLLQKAADHRDPDLAKCHTVFPQICSDVSWPPVFPWCRR
ncbi:hypothetical protein GYMLUDRAFT_161094 [Collybiopsis luxurians FD-317 M1]|nr:hypothetical protein GYMLUDRAFT_161094 [Collybiopsis luxurians FD-317 M1]